MIYVLYAYVMIISELYANAQEVTLFIKRKWRHNYTGSDIIATNLMVMCLCDTIGSLQTRRAVIC